VAFNSFGNGFPLTHILKLRNVGKTYNVLFKKLLANYVILIIRLSTALCKMTDTKAVDGLCQVYS